MKELTVLLPRTDGEEESKLIALAAWMGVPTVTLTVSDGEDLIERMCGGWVKGGGCLAVSATTLASLSQLRESEQFKTCLRDRCDDLFVFGVTNEGSHRQAVEWLTGNAISTQVIDTETGRVSIAVEARALSHQLAGSVFDVGDKTPSSGLRLCTESQAIMLKGDVPLFAQIKSDWGGRIFVLTDVVMPDVRQKVSATRDMRDVYVQLIAPMIFLRGAFGDVCWHGTESTAHVIIDDPLLKSRYGCIEFDRLGRSAREIGYRVTVAFIPWNYCRTSERMASTFNADVSNLSVCIHGCDHIGDEFGIRDRTVLTQKARLAVRRMEAQRSRTGISFERVMVFPQGRFSTEAVDALREGGYVAAVDSGCIPTDADGRAPTVGELLRPAIQFHGFPVFKRHYPRRLSDFAMDLFLGRPVLVVEHHGYFRDGGVSLEDLVMRLRTIAPDVKWSTLTSQLTRSCLERMQSDRASEVRFFTREFHLQNRFEHGMHYRLWKEEPDPTRVVAVVAGGRSVPFEIRGGVLSLEVALDAKGSTMIEIKDREAATLPGFRASRGYGCGVRVRRVLSEMRDEGLGCAWRILRARQS